MPVRVRLVVEFERVIGVREVLLRLSFDFPVGFNPIKKLGSVVHVFGLCGLIIFESFVVPLFFLLAPPCRCRQRGVSRDSCHR